MAQQIDFDPNLDYYKTLGVSESATADDIKKAYRKLAKANHPDSTGGDKAKETRFKAISNAYDVLGDAKKRGLYDQLRAGGGGAPFQGFPGRGAGAPGVGVFDLGDLFGQFFGGQQRGGGGDSRVRVVDDHDDEPETVRASDGSWLRIEGRDVHSDARISFDRAILGTVVSVATIDGKADVKIPPGSSSGRKLRLRGKGMTDRAGRGPAGDHYVTVQIDVPGDLDDEQKELLVQFVRHLKSGSAKKP
ncbi:MAG: DnaJ domain-containing protein [Proteobacteria bacterium]|nr:DnaJ domain-containing protein [Pseudomonadota bacterium]